MNEQQSSIFAAEDYRKALRDELMARKAALPRRYSFQKLADACKVQKTYLSTALGTKGHLSRDQLYRAAMFVGLTSAETEFLELLYEWQRSDCAARRKTLGERIEQARRAARRTERRLRAEVVDSGEAELGAYYLDPVVQVIHLFLTVPFFAGDLRAIAGALQVSENRVHQAVETLLRLKLAAVDGSIFRSLRDAMHLPASSPLYAAHRKLLRLAALERQERLAPQEGYGFSVVFSSNEAVRAELQDRILAFISNAQTTVEAGDCREVYQMNFDLFPWSRGLI